MMATDDFKFRPLGDTDAEFLLGILDVGYIVRIFDVAIDGRNHVTHLSEPLTKCRGQICSYCFRRLYATVRLTLDGQKKEAKFGIILSDGLRHELVYGRVETAVVISGKYAILVLTKESKESNLIKETTQEKKF